MAVESPAACLTIYRVDSQRCVDKGARGGDCLADVVLDRIEEKLEADTSVQKMKVSFGGSSGFVFCKTNPSPSAKLMRYLLSSDAGAKKANVSGLTMNKHASCILVFPPDGYRQGKANAESTYILVGGYAVSYIMPHVDLEFGLSLLTKLFDEDSSVLKKNSIVSLFGSVADIVSTNRKVSSFANGKTVSEITRECRVELPQDCQEELGMPKGDDAWMGKSVTAAFSLCAVKIQKELTLAEFKQVLRSIECLRKREDKFQINGLLPASRNGVKDSELDELLVSNVIANGAEADVLITGSEYDRFVDAYRSMVAKETRGECFLYAYGEGALSYSGLYSKLVETGRMSRQHVKNALLLGELVTYSGDTSNPEREPMRSAIMTSVSHDNVQYHLCGGRWQYIPDRANDEIHRRFMAMLADSEVALQSLKEKYGLSAAMYPNVSNESEFNEELRKHIVAREMVVVHKAFVPGKRIELADIIMRKGGTLYFLHIKNKFNGLGARDVFEQALVAAKMWREVFSSENATSVLGDYYERVCGCYSKSTQPAKAAFFDMFSNASRIVLVAGFISGLGEKSGSAFAKILARDIADQAQSRYGMEFYLMDLK